MDSNLGYTGDEQLCSALISGMAETFMWNSPSVHVFWRRYVATSLNTLLPMAFKVFVTTLSACNNKH